MVRCTLITLFALCLLAPPSLAQDHCLPYGPSPVQLVGSVAVREFAGPPNYQSIGTGDAAEQVLLLILEQPICTWADTTSVPAREAVYGVFALTVVSETSDSILVSVRDGQRVKAVGTLSPAITNHPKTRLVLDLRSIEARTQHASNEDTPAVHEIARTIRNIRRLAVAQNWGAAKDFFEPNTAAALRAQAAFVQPGLYDFPSFWLGSQTHMSEWQITVADREAYAELPFYFSYIGYMGHDEWRWGMSFTKVGDHWIIACEDIVAYSHCN